MTSLVCSARACRADAVYALKWRNPALHSVDRVKVWLACEEHGPHLHQFLASRGFPIEVVPVEELDEP